MNLANDNIKINKESVITEKKIERKNDKGEEIPEVCPKCGSKIGLYIKGEPVWLCSNKNCNTYFGTLPFNEFTNDFINGTIDEIQKIEDSLSIFENAQTLQDYKDIVDKVHSEYEKYKNGGKSSNQNCLFSTWATELQARGNDILPRPVYSPRDIIFSIKGENIVNNSKRIKFSSIDEVKSILQSSGKNSRFYCHVNWKNSSSGHEFIIANIDGYGYIVDGQAGLVEKIGSPKVKRYLEDINYKNSYIVRMDDKDINDKILKYNDNKYIKLWDDKKDIAYLKKHHMISESTKIPDVLYHGSSKKLSKITVHDSGVSGKYVFGTDDYKFALAYAGNQWNDLQINQAYYNGKYILTEIKKGAFKKVFDRNGYVYYMDGSTFEIPSYNERSNHEYGSKIDVVPFKVDIIPNVLEALKKNSEVTLYNYPNLPPFIKDRDEYLLKRKKLFGMTEAMKEFDSTDLVKNLYENYFKDSYNSINPPKPSTLGFYRTDGSGIWNSLVIENGIRWRERAETIIVKGNQVLLRFKSDGIYKVPGGGTEPTLTMEETAIKECQEEVSITPYDLKYYGSYRNKYDQSKDGYYGVICHYFVGKYKEPYKGYVDDHDLDVGMKNGSKWYNISSIMDKLIPEHKKALIDYLHLQKYIKEFTEDFIVESGEFAGKKRSELPDSVFGIPEERKYPMPDRKHVISAIKLFNHVEPKYEEDLAKRIIYRARKYKIDLSFVGEKNRLYKYIHENTEAFESSMEDILNSFDVYTEARREVKNLEDFKESYHFEPINMTKDDAAKVVDADIKATGLITMGDKKYFCIIGKNIETCAFTKNKDNRVIEELVKKYPKLKEAIRNDKLNGYMYGSEYLSGTRYNSQKKHAFIMSHEQGHQELGHTTPDYRLSLDDETIIKNAKAKFNRNLQSASDKFKSNEKDNNALATYKKEVKDAYKKYISEVDKNLSKKDLNANETIRSKMREESRKILKKYELGDHSRVDEFEADLFAKMKSNQSSDQIIDTLSNMYRQDEKGKNIEDIKDIDIRIKNDIESRQKALNDKDIEKYKKAYDLSDKSLDKKIMSENEVKLRAKKLNKKRDLVSYNNKRERVKADIQYSLDCIKDDKEEIEKLQNIIKNNYKGVTPGREKNIDKRLEDYKQTLEDDKKELNEYKAKLKALPYRTESSEGVENMDIVSKMFESFFGETLFKKSEAESFVDSFFEESNNDSDIPDMIEPEVKKLEAKGYQVKYASPGHENTTFKNDKNDDKIINGKYRSTGRIIFSRNYNFKNTPKGWEWKSIDNGEKKALYVKPYTYNEELGSKEQVFKRWREFYLKSLVDWIEELPEAGTDNNENKKDENFSAS